jgi:tRNA-dihydrouridine synthase B
MNTLQSTELQLQAINDFFAELKSKNERLVYEEVGETNSKHSKDSKTIKEAIAA